MAIPTVADVMDLGLSLLSDEDQQLFSANGTPGMVDLRLHYGTAYRELYSLFVNWHLPISEMDCYYSLAPYTNRFTPAQAGIVNLGEPVRVWERGAGTSVAVSDISATTPIVVTTSTPHNLATNQPIELTGVIDPFLVNGLWYPTVLSPTTFSLNGSVALDAYSSGGLVMTSAEEFIPMNPVTVLPQTTPTTPLSFYRWENDTFWFVGSPEARQIWVEYTTSGSPPATGSVGIDDSLNFLAHRMASLAAPLRDMQPGRIAELKELALGPEGQADGRGGMLRQLALPMLKQKQNIVFRRQPFRARRYPFPRVSA